MPRTRRVALVTLGLAAAGAAVGAAAAIVGLIAVTLVVVGPARGLTLVTHVPAALALVGGRGAVVGAFAGPAVAWGLLRYVPLGRAVAGLGAGALVGGVAVDWFVGELMRRFWGGPIPGVHAWLWGSALGMLAAGLLLRRAAGRRAARGVPVPPPNVALRATPYAGLPAAHPSGPSYASADAPLQRRA